jgi:hypothetical protein
MPVEAPHHLSQGALLGEARAHPTPDDADRHRHVRDRPAGWLGRGSHHATDPPRVPGHGHLTHSAGGARPSGMWYCPAVDAEDQVRLVEPTQAGADR